MQSFAVFLADDLTELFLCIFEQGNAQTAREELQQLDLKLNRSRLEASKMVTPAGTAQYPWVLRQSRYCRKYVKSQKARGRYRHTSTHKTQALSRVRRGNKGRSEERNKRREAPCFLFIFLSFYWLMYNNYFNHISTNCKTVLFRYTLVVQYRAPTAITRYRCYRYRILPVTLY